MQYAKSSVRTVGHNNYVHHFHCRVSCWQNLRSGDRKSTRLNSSHDQISYAVFCLKKKTEQQPTDWDFMECPPVLVQTESFFTLISLVRRTLPALPTARPYKA